MPKKTDANKLPMFRSQMDVASYFETQSTHAALAIGLLAAVNELLERGDWRSAHTSATEGLRILRTAYDVMPEPGQVGGWNVRARVTDSGQ